LFYLITTTVISHCSQFVSHHNYSFKSLFTVFISSQLQFEVTVHSFFSSQLHFEVTVHIFYLSTTTVISHFSQFLSHHNYRLKSLFTVVISSQLQFEVTVHSFFSSQLYFEVTVDIFYLITSTVISHFSQFLFHHPYSMKSLFTIFISSQLQFEITVHSFITSQLLL